MKEERIRPVSAHIRITQPQGATPGTQAGAGHGESQRAVSSFWLCIMHTGSSLQRLLANWRFGL